MDEKPLDSINKASNKYAKKTRGGPIWPPPFCPGDEKRRATGAPYLGHWKFAFRCGRR